MTGLLIIGIVFGVVLCGNLVKISLASVIPGIGDYGLGISVSNDKVILPDANPLSRPFVYATHKVSVKSPYHMGYRLTVLTYGTQTVDGSMYGQQGNFIRPVQDSKNLAPDSWGYTISDSQSNEHTINDVWHNVPQDGYGREISSNYGWQPGDDNIDEQYITYGANIGWSNHPDSYVANIKYTVTPQEPTTPAILRIDDGGDCLIGEACQLQLTGVQLEKINRVGVDFNGNDSVDDVEACSKWTIDTQYQYTASCELPQFDSSYIDANNVAGADEFGGVFQLLIDSNDGTMNSGHQITYRYQPRIDSVEVLNSDSNDTLTIKDSVGVIDMVSTDSTSMMLTDDGDVYLWGNTPLHDGNNWIFDKTMAPTMVKLPDLTNTDRIVDIDAYGNSYYAVSRQGYLYAWGDNSARQLPLDNNSGWIVSPSKSGYYDTNKDNRQANMVIVGDGFGATVDAPRSDDDKNMSSWGANNHGQLGRNSINDGTWMVNTVAEGSYPLIDGEEFIQADAGKANVIAVTDAGRVFTWGEYGGKESDEQYGNRLGFKATEDARRPHDITFSDGSHNNDLGYNYLRAAYHDESKRFIQVAMGDDFAIVLARDRYDDNKRFVYTIGSDNMGQNGDGFYGEPGCWAHDITGQFGGKVVVGFSTNGQSAAAWTSSGQLYVWGDNLGGKLGAVDNVLYAPVAVLGDYSIDKVALGGINYARTTNGRLLAWGGENNDGSFINQYGVADITNKLAHPSYHIKVMGQNLDKSDVWLDFNRNEIMDENEKPLAKNCISTNTCYLQVSTDNAAVGEGYQVVTTTPHGGRYLSGDSGAVMNVEYSTARRHEERPNDEPLLDVNGDEFVKNNSLTSMQSKPSNAMATDKDSGEDDSSVLEGEDDNVDVTNNDISADPGDSSNNATGEVDSESTKDGDDLGSGQEANDNVSDDKVDSGGCVCVTSGDASTDSDTGRDYDGETIDCECDDKLSGDSSKCGGMITDADCGEDMCDSLDKTNLCRCTNNSALDKLEANVDDDNLSVNISSGAQIQLVDGRRKGCFDGVGSVNVDD